MGSLFVKEGDRPDEVFEWLLEHGTYHGDTLFDSKTCKDDLGADGEAWADSLGKGCLEYERYHLCTKEGRTGSNWTNDRPPMVVPPLYMLQFGTVFGLEHWERSGLHGGQACCACGGG